MVFSLVLLGLGTTLQPVPLGAYLLLLTSANGRRKGALFICGWLASYGAVLALVLTLTGGSPPPSHSSTSLLLTVAKLLVGLGLVLFALRRRARWQKAPPPTHPPTWVDRLDRLPLWTAPLTACLVQPWPLIGIGALEVTSADLASWATVWILVGFCLLCSATLLIVQIWSLVDAEAASARARSLRSELLRHQRQVIMVGAFVLGLYLTIRSVAALVLLT